MKGKKQTYIGIIQYLKLYLKLLPHETVTWDNFTLICRISTYLLICFSSYLFAASPNYVKKLRIRNWGLTFIGIDLIYLSIIIVSFLVKIEWIMNVIWNFTATTNRICHLWANHLNFLWSQNRLCTQEQLFELKLNIWPNVFSQRLNMSPVMAH